MLGALSPHSKHSVINTPRSYEIEDNREMELQTVKSHKYSV